MKNIRDIIAKQFTFQKTNFASFKEFFQESLKDFQHTGTLFPSSRFACKRICTYIPNDLKCIVEYGSGNGALTRSLLEKLTPGGRLFALEINDYFISRLSQISDHRLTIIRGDVIVESEKMQRVAGGEIDAIVSGIPFSFLSKGSRQKVIDNTWSNLKTGGTFVVYQNSIALLSALKNKFGQVSVHFEPRNITPYFIMVAKK